MASITTNPKVIMNTLDKDLVMDLFLDNDSVSTLNRLIVAVANVVHENNENMMLFTTITQKHCMYYDSITNCRDQELGTITRRVKGFYENIVLNFSDEEYEEKFKMKKSTVNALINYIDRTVKCSDHLVTLDKKVHIFLWFITSSNSYSEISNLFGIHKKSICYIINEMCSILQDHYYDFINWPSIEEQNMTSIKVNNKFKYPNCVGFVDACRLKVKPKPSKRNNQDSVLIQVVCDESLMFVDVHIGEVGKMNKEKVFKMSPLSRELKNFVAFENHILGDAEYKLRKNLITPFTCDELLTHEEMKFNEVHWRALFYVNRALEMLKVRFRRINYLDVSKSENFNIVIIAACVLHNFVLLHEGISEDIKEEIILCEDGVIIDKSIVRTALEKRQFLCNYISYIDGT